MDLPAFRYHGYFVRPASGSESEALSRFFHEAGDETDFLSFSGCDCPYTPGVCEDFIAACEQQGNLLLLAFDDEVLIGELSFTAPHRKRFSHTRELGIALRKAYCDKGLGTAMLKTALKWADENDVDSISLTVSKENARGLHLYEKLGFSVYGVYPRQSFYNGVYHDTVYMVRFRQETAF